MNGKPFDTREVGETQLVDCDNLPREGVYGREGIEWLTALGIPVPDFGESLCRQGGNLLVARTGPQQVLLVRDWATLPDTGAQDGETPLTGIERPQGVTFYPWRHSHHACCLQGSGTGGVLARLCALDLSPASFPILSFAQTRMAGASVLVIRHDRRQEPACLLLVERSLAEYFRQVLGEARRAAAL